MKIFFKACLNPKILLGVGTIIVLVYIFIPGIANYSWILITLVCPFSMMLMMVGMNHDSDKPEKIFACLECGMSYKDVELAKKCAAWCKEHKSCNLDIVKHAIKESL